MGRNYVIHISKGLFIELELGFPLEIGDEKKGLLKSGIIFTNLKPEDQLIYFL